MIALSARMMSLGVFYTGQRLRKLRFLMTDNRRHVPNPCCSPEARQRGNEQILE
jgi:hypothetical protein